VHGWQIFVAITEMVFAELTLAYAGVADDSLWIGQHSARIPGDADE
jgi:hypothetical protein